MPGSFRTLARLPPLSLPPFLKGDRGGFATSDPIPPNRPLGKGGFAPLSLPLSQRGTKGDLQTPQSNPSTPPFGKGRLCTSFPPPFPKGEPRGISKLSNLIPPNRPLGKGGFAPLSLPLSQRGTEGDLQTPIQSLPTALWEREALHLFLPLSQRGTEGDLQTPIQSLPTALWEREAFPSSISSPLPKEEDKVGRLNPIRR